MKHVARSTGQDCKSSFGGNQKPGEKRGGWLIGVSGGKLVADDAN